MVNEQSGKKKAKKIKNKFRIEGNEVVISLNHDLETRIDLKCWPLVSPYKWHASERRNSWVIKTSFVDDDGKSQTLYLHRLILGITELNIRIAHLDGDLFNNVRSNLEVIPLKGKTLNGQSTTYHGVFRLDEERCAAIIKDHGRHVLLRSSNDEVQCARAFDLAAIVLQKKGAKWKLNFDQSEYNTRELNQMREFLKENLEE